MKDLQSTEEFRELSQSNKRFCALYSADWCPDCVVIKAILPELEEMYGDDMEFRVVDRDDFMPLAQEYDVMGIPSFVVFREGKVVADFISSLRKTRQQIVDFLEKAKTA